MLAAIAIGLGILLSPAPPTPEEAKAAAERVFDEGAWQKDLPNRESSTGGAGGTRPRPPRRRPGTEAPPPRDEGAGTSRGSGEWGLTVAKALLWVFAAVGTVLLVVWLAQLFRSRGAVYEPPRAVVAKADPGRPVPASVYEDAEAAADAGRYAEAIHILLLRTLAALAAAATGTGLLASLTSREILARADLEPSAKDALGGLVSTVEVSWFGNRALGPGDWADCKERFRRLVAPERAAGTASGATA